MNVISNLSDVGMLINIFVMSAYGLFLINGRNSGSFFQERFFKVVISLMVLSAILLYLHYRF
jgi:hypothetical protein